MGLIVTFPTVPLIPFGGAREPVSGRALATGRGLDGKTVEGGPRRTSHVEVCWS